MLHSLNDKNLLKGETPSSCTSGSASGTNFTFQDSMKLNMKDVMNSTQKAQIMQDF